MSLFYCNLIKKCHCQEPHQDGTFLPFDHVISKHFFRRFFKIILSSIIVSHHSFSSDKFPPPDSINVFFRMGDKVFEYIIMQYNHSIESDKCVFCVDNIIKDFLHGMNCCFSTSLQTGCRLQRTCSNLDIIFLNPTNPYYPSQDRYFQCLYSVHQDIYLKVTRCRLQIESLVFSQVWKLLNTILNFFLSSI